MFNNAKIYNETGSAIYIMADNMLSLIKQEILLLEDAINYDNAVKTSVPSLNDKDVDMDEFSSEGKSPPPKRRKLNSAEDQE